MNKNIIEDLIQYKEILEENREQDWDFEDYMADIQHEQMMIENEGDYFRKC